MNIEYRTPNFEVKKEDPVSGIQYPVTRYQLPETSNPY